jgi:hypothetical protein
MFAYRGEAKGEGITDLYELLTDQTTSDMYAVLRQFVLGRSEEYVPPPETIESEKPSTAQVIEFNGRIAAR